MHRYLIAYWPSKQQILPFQTGHRTYEIRDSFAILNLSVSTYMLNMHRVFLRTDIFTIVVFIGKLLFQWVYSCANTPYMVTQCVGYASFEYQFKAYELIFDFTRSTQLHSIWLKSTLWSFFNFAGPLYQNALVQFYHLSIRPHYLCEVRTSCSHLMFVFSNNFWSCYLDVSYFIIRTDVSCRNWSGTWWPLWKTSACCGGLRSFKGSRLTRR